MKKPEPAVRAGDSVAVQLSQGDLDLILRGLGELLYKPAGDVELVAGVHELGARLKQVHLAHGPSTPGATRP